MGSHRLGSHRLGPAAIGQRVVVRHLLHDGRASDVLGTCLAWSDDEVVIERDGSGPIRIPTATIVTGKPVPPRASVRNRVSPRDVEAHAFADWPEVAREPLGEWVLRSSPAIGGRLLKRANSVLAMGDPGVSLTEAAGRALDFFTAADRVPLAQVEQGGEIETGLLNLGWSPLGVGDSAALLASVAGVVRRLPAAPDSLEVTEGATRISAELPEVARGAATLDEDWLCVHSLWVEPDHRRQGRARQVLAELVDWGASRGALTVWLHVEDDNEPALRLYDSLGFRAHHRNRYLTT